MLREHCSNKIEGVDGKSYCSGGDYACKHLDDATARGMDEITGIPFNDLPEAERGAFFYRCSPTIIKHIKGDLEKEPTRSVA